MDITKNLEAMLASGRDSAMLRVTLASHYFDTREFDKALGHAEVAVGLDADYSAAWRALGRVLAAKGFDVRAAEAFRNGIEVATRRGDRQAAKEMQVFLKRLEPKT